MIQPVLYEGAMEKEALSIELKTQYQQLNQLIARFKHAEQINAADLAVYDETTRKIEKRLRTLRKMILQKSSSKTSPFQNNKKAKGE